jgi:hypothetical protein
VVVLLLPLLLLLLLAALLLWPLSALSPTSAPQTDSDNRANKKRTGHLP